MKRIDILIILKHKDPENLSVKRCVDYVVKEKNIKVEICNDKTAANFDWKYKCRMSGLIHYFEDYLYDMYTALETTGFNKYMHAHQWIVNNDQLVDEYTSQIGILKCEMYRISNHNQLYIEESKPLGVLYQELNPLRYCRTIKNLKNIS